MKGIFAIGMTALILALTCSVIQATSFLYQATGTFSYQVDNQLVNTEVWGSAIISDQLYGTMASPDYVYSPGIASESYFYYSIESIALGFDFGAVAATCHLLYWEAYSGNRIDGFSINANISGLNTDDWKFLHPDGTPYSPYIYEGDRFIDTSYGQLAPVVKIHLQGEACPWGIGGSGDILLTRVEPVPEPATILLLGAGLAGLAGSRFRRKK